MGVYDELKARGLIAQMTDEEKVRDLLNNGKTSFYIGFDPTADSLHVGHSYKLWSCPTCKKQGICPSPCLEEVPEWWGILPAKAKCAKCSPVRR